MADFQLHKLPMAKHLLKWQQREELLAAARLLLRQPGLGNPLPSSTPQHIQSTFREKVRFLMGLRKSSHRHCRASKLPLGARGQRYPLKFGLFAAPLLCLSCLSKANKPEVYYICISGI